MTDRTAQRAFAASGRWLALSTLAPLVLSGCAETDRLTAPIALEYAEAFGQPETPRHVYGKTWLIGSGTLNVALINTGAGLVLIDAGLPQWAPALERNIAQLGFDLDDVTYILSSEPHYDHAGGLAALVRASGATVVSSPDGARVLRAGHSELDDPQHDELFAYPAITKLRELADGQTLTLGSVTFTAHATPGHTPGSMSWSWRECEGTDCRDMVFGASLTSRTDGRYRFSATQNAAALANFRAGLARMHALPCDILMTGHPAHAPASEGKAADFAPQPCARYADRYEAMLSTQLDQE